MSNTTTKSFIGKILFVVGIIIILIILASLIIKFVPRVFSGLANIGSSIDNVFGKDEISVTASDVSLTNSERFVVSWESNINKTGLYNISHSCVDKVTVDIETTSGIRRMICGDTFVLGPTTGSVTLIANLNKENAFADIPVIVSFVQDEKTLASNEVVVTIQNGDPNAGTGISAQPVEPEEEEPTTPVKTTTSTTRPTTQPRTVVYAPTVTGPADLSISKMASIANNKIVFTVSNNGGRSSGNWYFNYTTPTNPKETVVSPLQPSLGAGQSIFYTLTLAAKSSGNQNVVIQLDPNNLVQESSESNNSASLTLSGSAFGGGSNNNTDNSYDSKDDADFIISKLEVGRISGNNFVQDDEAEEGDDIAIRFIVKNQGGDETEDWRFEIRDLPYDSQNTFRSKEYNSLRPGESIVITAEFDNIDEGDFDIRVEVDSEDDTDEESESNNDDSIDLEVEN